MSDPRAYLPPQNRLAPPPTDLTVHRGRRTQDPGADGTFLHVRWTAHGAVVVLSGEVDLSTAPRLTAVGRLLAGWDQRPVVDASAVTFIDLAGLGALQGLSGGAASVLVVQPSPCLLRLLRVLSTAGCGPAVRSLGDREHALLLAPLEPHGAGGGSDAA